MAMESGDAVERVAAVRRNGGNSGNEGWWEVKMAGELTTYFSETPKLMFRWSSSIDV